MGPLGDFSLITFHDGEFTQNEFERALDFGNPILIRGANKRLQPASWEPNEFAERYGSDTVSPIDTTTDQPVRPMKAKLPSGQRHRFGLDGLARYPASGLAITRRFAEESQDLLQTGA